MGKKPPLRIWMLLFVFAAALVFSLIVQSRLILLNDAASLDSALTRRAGEAGEKSVVLIIGTSLTQSGLDSGSRIARCVKEEMGKDIVILKCWVSGGDLERICTLHKSLFHRLHPSVVLIEDNMFFYRPVKTPPLSVFGQTFRDIVNGRTHRPYDPDERVEKLPADRAAIESARAGLIDSTDLVSFPEICAAWYNAGTRIALVHLPIETKMEEKKWNSPDTSFFRKNLDYLRGICPLPRYDAGLKLDSSFFFDFGHLNRKGNDAFAPCFCRFVSMALGHGAMEINTPGK